MKNKKTVLDFSGVMPIDLDGNQYTLQDANKVIGNRIFVYCRSIEMDAIARSLHAGKKTEVTSDDLERIKHVLDQDPNPSFIPVGMRAIIEHINSLLTK